VNRCKVKDNEVLDLLQKRKKEIEDENNYRKIGRFDEYVNMKKVIFYFSSIKKLFFHRKNKKPKKVKK
jgi:hypothetical protein